MLEGRITDIVKDTIAPYLHEGDVVLDLTVGNGHDTLYLANKVGVQGKVYAFDVQLQALENTEELLNIHHLRNRVTLIHAGHEMLSDYIHEKISVAMFNLGYLPGGDTRKITKAETTCLALNKVLKLLEKNGVVSIVCYYGHEGGLEEKEALEQVISRLDEKLYDVMTLFYPNRKRSAPFIHFIRKK